MPAQQRMAQMDQQYPQFGQNNSPAIPQAQMSAAPPAQNVTWIPVSGVQGAKDHIIQPGATAWLMDNNDTVFYVKASDNLGVTSLKAFRFAEIGLEQTQMPQMSMDTSQYVQRAEFDELKARLEELTTSQVKRPVKANKEVSDNG
jgi:hypothetical protein